MAHKQVDCQINTFQVNIVSGFTF